MNLPQKENFPWNDYRTFLQWERFRPLYDRKFGALLKRGIPENLLIDANLKKDFINTFHWWITTSELNTLSGLEAFPHRDFISGVTHSLDDLLITFSEQLVCLENEYLYFRRIRDNFPYKKVSELRRGDVLVLGMPFCWHGDVHPETKEILEHCLKNEIPVHIDSAWYGCTKGIEFNYDHPAIRSVSFSLSKGLGLGSHRAGVRYSKVRHPGPVTITNDFSMEIQSSMAIGLLFMKEFGPDFLQKKYGPFYDLTCSKLSLLPTKAIHMAFAEKEKGLWLPAGVRPFLRYFGDDKNEFC